MLWEYGLDGMENTALLKGWKSRNLKMEEKHCNDNIIPRSQQSVNVLVWQVLSKLILHRSHYMINGVKLNSGSQNATY